MEHKAEIKTEMQHMCCYFAYRHAKDISDLSENSLIMFFDPQNVGLETYYVQLS